MAAPLVGRSRRSPNEHRAALVATGSCSLRDTDPACRDGHLAWVGDQRQRRHRRSRPIRDTYVGTIRDVTAARASSAREQRGAAPCHGGRRGQERGRACCDHTPDECRDAHRSCAASWPSRGPTARPSRPSRWPESRRAADGGTSIRGLQATFEDARRLAAADRRSRSDGRFRDVPRHRAGV